MNRTWPGSVRGSSRWQDRGGVPAAVCSRGSHRHIVARFAERGEAGVIDLLALYAEKGGKEYGERVTQTAHALQSAALAEAEQAPPPLVAAALLHDLGHLLAKQVDDVDDRHEHIAAGYLAR